MLGTVAGQVMGTAGYMAPEQVEAGEIDGRTDLFAFGCVLYEMIGGGHPFAGRSLHQTLDLIVNEEPAPLGEISPGLPVLAHWIVRKCLAKDPSERYQSADDLTIDLRALLVDVQTGTANVQGAGDAIGGTPEARSSRVRTAVAAAVLVATGAVVGALGWGGVSSYQNLPRRMLSRSRSATRRASGRKPSRNSLGYRPKVICSYLRRSIGSTSGGWAEPVNDFETPEFWI